MKDVVDTVYLLGNEKFLEKELMKKQQDRWDRDNQRGTRSASRKVLICRVCREETKGMRVADHAS